MIVHGLDLCVKILTIPGLAFSAHLICYIFDISPFVSCAKIKKYWRSCWLTVKWVCVKLSDSFRMLPFFCSGCKVFIGRNWKFLAESCRADHGSFITIRKFSLKNWVSFPSVFNTDRNSLVYLCLSAQITDENPSQAMIVSPDKNIRRNHISLF